MKQYVVKHTMIGANLGLQKGVLIDEKTLQDRGVDINHLLTNQAIEEYKTEEERAAEQAEAQKSADAASDPEKTDETAPADTEKPAADTAAQNQEKEPKAK